MHRIEYRVPTSVHEAVQMLAASPGRARVLAGGTDLIVQVRENLRDWDIFVEGKKIAELSAMSFDKSGALTLGAAVPCYKVYGDATLVTRFPGLADAARIIGGIGIQGRASIGGNLCNAGPAGDSIPALIALRAIAHIAGPKGERTLAAEAFCTAPGRNALAPDELLVKLTIPAPAAGSGSAYIRFIPREEMDIAVVGAGVALRLEKNVIKEARIAIGAVAPTPLFVPEASEALIGQEAGRPAFERAAAIAQAASKPISDMRGTAEHRKHLVAVLVRRALERAAERATGAAS